MASNEWLYSRGDNHQEGPVSAKELNRLASSGELSSDDLIWKEGMEDWVPASRIKGLEFPATPSKNPKQKFDAERLQSTLDNAQEKVDEASKTFWFFDIKFENFVSATIVRFVWGFYLLFGLLGLGLGILGSVLRLPILEAVLYSAVMSLGFVLGTLMLRMFLESLMVIFRISDQLKEVNNNLRTRE